VWDGMDMDIDRFTISENQNIFMKRTGQMSQCRAH
jgi:hypothetical protein